MMMNFRFSTLLWIVLVVVGAFGLYMVKYKVQAVRVEVASTETQLREARKNLHVLTAEWTYLNRPERLRQLAARYLAVKPTQGRQLTDVASLPVKSPTLAKAGGEEPATDATDANDGITLVSGAPHDE